MVIRAVGACDLRLVSGGQTGTGLEAEVRGVCLRGVIAGVSIIVGIAVGVKDNDTAGFHCRGDVVNGCRGGLVQRIGAAGGLGNGLGLVDILGGEAAVNAVIGLDQCHIHGRRAAALGRVGGDLNTGIILRVGALNGIGADPGA